MASKREESLRETVAALGVEVGMNTELRDAYYHRNANRMGGFPGVWRLVQDAAVALEDVAREEKIEWGENADYILTIERYAPALLAHDGHNYTQIARQSIARE